MSGRWRASAAILAVSMGLGCAGHSAPAGFLPRTAEAGAHTLGGWVDVSVRGGGRLTRAAGELIAITADTLWVLESTGVTVVPMRNVMGGQLVGYDSDSGMVGVTSVVGVLSTAANGVFLMLTAPMWMIGGSFAAVSQSKVAIDKLPGVDINQAAAFARFPQGIPPGLNLQYLRPPRR
jgi:hypothetical protein